MKPAPIRSQFGEYVLLSSYNNVWNDMKGVSGADGAGAHDYDPSL